MKRVSPLVMDNIEKLADERDALRADLKAVAVASLELVRWHRNEGADTDVPPSEFVNRVVDALARPGVRALYWRG